MKLAPGRFVRDRLTPGALGLEVATLLAVALVGSFILVGLALPVGRGEAITSDPDALRIAADLRSGAVTDVARVVTYLGATVVVAVVVLIAMVWLARRHRIVEAGVLVAGSLVTWLAVNLIKVTVARPRPGGGLVEAAGASFPSGHAAYAMAYLAVGVVWARSLHRSRWRAGLSGAMISLAAVVGLTRVYLRVHYWSDVLAGWALGAAVFSVCGLVALIVGALRHNAAQP